MFKSIRTRLTLTFILLAIGPILVVGLVVSYRSVTALQAEAVTHQRVEAQRVRIVVEDYVRELERVLELTSRAHGFTDLRQSEQRTVLEELLAYENRFEELTLINTDGKELVRCNRIHVVFANDLRDRGKDPVFQQALTLGANCFGPVEFNPATGEPHMTIALPLKLLLSGKTEYVLLGSVRLKKIWNLLAAISHENQTVYLVDGHGNIVGHPDPSVALSGRRFTLPLNTDKVTTGLGHSQVILAVAPLQFGDQSLFVVAERSVSTALALATSIVEIMLMVVLGSLGVAIVLSVMTIGRIVRPLQHLSSVARDIQQGKLDQQVEWSRNDEVGDLARAFNDMTTKLRLLIDSLVQEVDERKQAERETALAFERFKTVMDSIDALVYVADMESYEVLFINEYGRDLWGEITGKICWMELQRDQEGPCPFCTNTKLLDGAGQPAGVHVWESQNTVTRKWYQCRDQAIKWTDQRLVRMEIAVDITGRKETEKALAAEKERLAVTLGCIGDGVITTDTEGVIVLLNSVAEQLTGWPQKEALGKSLGEVFNIIDEKTRQPCVNPVAQVMASGQIVELVEHTLLLAKDGKELIVADSGAPIRDRENRIIGVVLVFRDVTEALRMEKELFKAKKLESVGVLAGGIAHDFNNILTAILGNVNLALLDNKLTIKTRELLAIAEKASIRAKDLTLQLLTFSKGGEPVKKTASISEIIRGSADFILHGSNIACQYNIPEDLWFVEVDKGQMSQVIQNIILNAKQAMPLGGTIEVSCENIASVAKKLLLSPQEAYIKISIKDTGIGLHEDVIEKIFDPYFTTKQEGSGLGLAVTHSIIRKHCGHISAQSKLGKGTTFIIYLPALRAGEQQQMIQESATPQARSVRVLIMDDEELVRDVAGEMLGHLRHQVLTVQDGEEALRVYKEQRQAGTPFDLVIMDLTIPGGMGGKDAVKKLLAIDPEAKVVVASGYSNDPVMANYLEYGFMATMVKPFTVEELRKTIENVL